MKFSLLHPSRNRPDMALDCFNHWISLADSNHTYEWFTSLDHDDSSYDEYEKKFKDSGVFIMSNANRSMVDATNVAAHICTGEILIMISDDFRCPENWVQSLIDAIPMDRPAVLHVKDGYSDANGDIMSIPIMNRLAYEKLGYIYHPDYFSMFADNDLFETAKKQGWLIESDLMFEHLTPYAGKNAFDATYERENSKEAYRLGQATFNRRKSEGFPI